MRLKNGFTLIELMIVVAILSVLAAIAYPSYQQYMKRGKRVDAQTEMLKVAQNLQSYYTINHNYTAATLDNNTTTKNFPSNSNNDYMLVLVPGDQTWTLTATPEPSGTMKSTGDLTLDSTGKQCWEKSSGACEPWDGK